MLEDVGQKKRIGVQVGSLARVGRPDELDVGIGCSSVRQGSRRRVDADTVVSGSEASDVGPCSTADVEESGAPRNVGLDDLRQNPATGLEPPVIPLDLIVQFDFTVGSSYCPAVSGRELAIYRFLGMGLFYVLAYGFHPSRLYRLIKGLMKGKFAPANLFEQRVLDQRTRQALLANKSRPPT